MTLHSDQVSDTAVCSKGRNDTIYVYKAGGGFSDLHADAVHDLVSGAQMWRIWAKLGWRDYLQQNGRNVWGPLWSIAGLGATVGILGYVYGALLSYEPRHGYPFTAGGLIAWFFIASCIGGGPFVFLNAAGLIKERPLPISFNVFQYTFRIYIEFLSKFAVFAIVAALTRFVPNANVLLLIPGLLIYFITGLWVTLLIGLGGSRYRDLNQIIGPIMLIVFLSTPILWPAGMLQMGWVASLNPFTHFIDIIREPLLGNAPSLVNYCVSAAIAVGGCALTFFVFARTKDRLIFWL